MPVALTLLRLLCRLLWRGPGARVAGAAALLVGRKANGAAAQASLLVLVPEPLLLAGSRVLLLGEGRAAPAHIGHVWLRAGVVLQRDAGWGPD